MFGPRCNLRPGAFVGADRSEKAPGNSEPSTDVAVASGTTSPTPARSAEPASRTRDAWRYRWNDGRWWYWTPEQKWMVWTGFAWVPYDQFFWRQRLLAEFRDSLPNGLSDLPDPKCGYGPIQPAILQ